MGYTTYFEGQFTLDRPLTSEHRRYLKAFSLTRRMRRNPELTAERDDPIREAAGLAVGDEGGYAVPAARFSEDDGLQVTDSGQERSGDVVAYSDPPADQPGLWCGWEPNDDGSAIVWDEGEKFYSYTEWIEYLIKHFLAPWGYTLSGEIQWSGEENTDMGKIVIEANVVRVKVAKIVYDD